MQLLANVAGRDRVLAAPEASDRISTACDKLPLALRIAGARRSTRPEVAVTMLASGSLDPVACSAFRALGSSGASPFTDATAEQLLGLRRTAIDRAMEDLVHHNQLTSVTAPVPSTACWPRTV